MNQAPLQLTRPQIAACPQQVLKEARSWFVPDVVRFLHEGTPYVLKDYGGRPWIVRETWGRWAIAHEAKAYERLERVSAVPHVLSMPDAYAFVMEFVEAHPLPKHSHAKLLTPDFFDRVIQAYQEMHACGVAHGDVRRRNILYTDSGQPKIIDFQSAIFDSGGPIRRRFFRFMSRVDDLTVLKISNRYFPDQTTPEQQRILDEAPWMLRLGRTLKHKVYAPLSPKVMKARWRGKGESKGEE